MAIIKRYSSHGTETVVLIWAYFFLLLSYPVTWRDIRG
jgi:hypothetical protein